MSAAITQSDRFPFRINYPVSVEARGEDDLHTATLFTLHVQVGDGIVPVPLAEVATTFAAFAATGCESITGMCGGDSWAEWAEPYEPTRRTDGRALHVAFVARDLLAAKRIAQGMCAKVGGRYVLDSGTCLSTTADWAEQTRVW